MVKFIKWLGTQTYLTNGQVAGWFEAGILIGMLIGIFIGVAVSNGGGS